MKKERILAGLLSAVLAVLAVRVLIGWPASDGEVVPAALDPAAPFYPVYFASRENGLLETEFQQVSPTIDSVLARLLAGPSLQHLVGALPAETAVLGYSQAGGTLYVSFSHHLVTNHPGGSTGEILTVYSIVNSLAVLAGVEQVQILVENQVIDTLAGHLNLRRALRPDYSALGASVL